MKRLSIYPGLIIAILLLILRFQGLAQQDTTKNEEVTVVSAFNPKVGKALKININPQNEKAEDEKPEIKYGIISKNVETPLSVNPITAARIKGESVAKLYGNYAKLGFGTTLSPYIEFFANKLRSKKSAFGVHIKHLSSAAGIKDYGYPGTAETYAGINGKLFGTNHSFTTAISFNRNKIHYYGFKPGDYPGTELSKKDIKQTFNTINVKSVYESTYRRKQALNHKLDLDYYYLFDDFQNSEHGVTFATNFYKNTGFFTFADEQKLGLDITTRFWFNNDSLKTESRNSGIISFKPYYNLIFSQYGFKIGADISLQTGSATSAHFYPIAIAEVQVIKNVLVTYAGIKGELKKNSLKSFADENPFINPLLPKHFTNYKFGQFGGAKGHISNYFDYNVMFVNYTVEEMPFFINDTSAPLAPGIYNKFTVVYDRVKYSRVVADLEFHYKNKFNAIIEAVYHNYFLDSLDYAWHKPAFELSISADYNMQDKFLITAGLFTFSRMDALVLKEHNSAGNIKVVTGSVESIKAGIDLNLGLEYRYSKILSGFVNFNNILNQHYSRFYNYPGYGFNLMLGMTYSF